MFFIICFVEVMGLLGVLAGVLFIVAGTPDSPNWALRALAVMAGWVGYGSLMSTAVGCAERTSQVLVNAAGWPVTYFVAWHNGPDPNAIR